MNVYLIAGILGNVDPGIDTRRRKVQMTRDELKELVRSLGSADDNFDAAHTLQKALFKLNERVEELEQAIRSFTSEENEDLAELLFSAMGQEAIDGDWSEALEKHREKITQLRSIVSSRRVG
jgi:hypothetical protein